MFGISFVDIRAKGARFSYDNDKNYKKYKQKLIYHGKDYWY